MSRTVVSGFVPTLGGAHTFLFAVAQLDLASGTQYLAHLDQDIEIGGQLYLGAGAVTAIENLKETSSLEATGFAMVLSGVPAAQISSAMLEEYKGREARLYAVTVNPETYELIGPNLEDVGTMDQMVVVRSGSFFTIKMNTYSKLANWARTKVRRHNDSDQRSRYPNDTSKKYVVQMAERQIAWPTSDYYR
jgi:hypothetical protein